MSFTLTPFEIPDEIRHSKEFRQMKKYLEVYSKLMKARKRIVNNKRKNL
jgi:hypothetical protein